MANDIGGIVQTGTSAIVGIYTAGAVVRTAEKAFGSKKRKRSKLL